MKCSAALTNSVSSCTGSGSISGEAGAGGCSSAANSERNAPEKASCVAFATCFWLSMFNSGSTGSASGRSGKATVLEGTGTGGETSAGLGSGLTVGRGTGSEREGAGAGSCAAGTVSAGGGAGKDAFSGTSTLAAVAPPLAKLAIGMTWPTTSRAASSSLLMVASASTDPSTLLSSPSKEVRYFTTSSLEPV